MSNTSFPHLAAILEDACRRYPQRDALVAGERRMSYGELSDRVKRLSSFFTELGVVKGDVVALCLGNDEVFIVAHYALTAIGAIVAPLNPQLGDEQIFYMLELCEAKCLVIGNDAQQELIKVRESGPDQLIQLRNRTSGDEPIQVRSHVNGVANGWTSLDDIGQGSSTVSIRADDQAVILFTSGTTGRPKAIRLTHTQALTGIDAWVRRWKFDDKTICIMAAPFFHVVYHPLIIGPHTRGGTSVILGELTARAGAREVQRLGATALMGNPAFFLQLLNDRKTAELDLSSLQTLIFGAAPAPVPVVKGLQELLPGASRFNCYGLTETASALSCLGPEDMVGREDSVGRPHPGVEVSIRDQYFRELPVGEVGEVCVKGPNVIEGYLRAPEVNAKRFADGYLRTGDVGSFDAEGFLRLLGRSDDQINVAGEKIYPREIEDVLFRCPELLEVTVLGQPHPKRGQVVRAFVVPRSGVRLDQQKLRTLAIRHLPAFAVPKSFTILEYLPRNANGKIDLQQLLNPK